MKIERRAAKKQRPSTGSAIAEFGPALFVIFILLVFPLIDLIGLTATYADCLYLNALLLRQASTEKVVVMDPSQTPPVVSLNQNAADIQKLQTDLTLVVTQWSNGFGKFASTGANPTFTTSVNLSEGTVPQSVSSPPTEYIHVLLTCQCNPVVSVPLPLSVPGLNAPITFSFNERSMLESIPPISTP